MLIAPDHVPERVQIEEDAVTIAGTRQARGASEADFLMPTAASAGHPGRLVATCFLLAALATACTPAVYDTAGLAPLVSSGGKLYWTARRWKGNKREWMVVTDLTTRESRVAFGPVEDLGAVLRLAPTRGTLEVADPSGTTSAANRQVLSRDFALTKPYRAEVVDCEVWPKTNPFELVLNAQYALSTIPDPNFLFGRGFIGFRLTDLRTCRTAELYGNGRIVQDRFMFLQPSEPPIPAGPDDQAMVFVDLRNPSLQGFVGRPTAIARFPYHEARYEFSQELRWATKRYVSRPAKFARFTRVIDGDEWQLPLRSPAHLRWVGEQRFAVIESDSSIQFADASISFVDAESRQTQRIRYPVRAGPRIRLYPEPFPSLGLLYFDSFLIGPGKVIPFDCSDQPVVVGEGALWCRTGPHSLLRFSASQQRVETFRTEVDLGERWHWSAVGSNRWRFAKSVDDAGVTIAALSEHDPPQHIRFEWSRLREP